MKGVIERKIDNNTSIWYETNGGVLHEMPRNYRHWDKTYRPIEYDVLRGPLDDTWDVTALTNILREANSDASISRIAFRAHARVYSEQSRDDWDYTTLNLWASKRRLNDEILGYKPTATPLNHKIMTLFYNPITKNFAVLDIGS